MKKRKNAAQPLAEEFNPMNVTDSEAIESKEDFDDTAAGKYEYWAAELNTSE